MSRKIEVVLALLFAGACNDTKRATATSDGAALKIESEASLATTTNDASANAADSDLGPARAANDGCEAPFADPKSGKSIGHTSVVFKLELQDGRRVLFKPHSKKGPSRYKGEVAAFRLAGLLGLPNVVPTCARTIPKKALEAALASRSDAAALFSEQAIVENDGVRGAAIAWVDKLEFVAFEKEPLASQWRSWMKRGGAIPPDKLDGLAREASAMVVFDYVTGNWDRFSGGNVGLERGGPEGERLLFIDNDGAFFDPPPKEGIARNKKLLQGMDRFPRGLVTRLRAVDEDRLRAAFGNDSDGRPLLSPSVVSAVGTRIHEVLAHVDAKIAQHGEAEVLFFR